MHVMMMMEIPDRDNFISPLDLMEWRPIYFSVKPRFFTHYVYNGLYILEYVIQVYFRDGCRR